MKKLKTITSIALVVSIIASLTACSDKNSPAGTEETTTVESTEPAETSASETTEETTTETSKKEAFTAPTAGPHASYLLANFLDDIDNLPVTYEDPELGGTLTILFYTVDSGTFIDFRYDSAAENTYLTISFDTVHRQALSGALSLTYSEDTKKSYLFEGFPANKYEDILFNINDEDFQVSPYTNIGKSIFEDSGNCDAEAIAHDAQLIYAKFVTACNRALQEYDSEFDISDYGFSVSDKTTSLDITEKLFCEE